MNPRVRNIPASIIREIAAKKRSTSIDLGLGEPSLRPTGAHLEYGMRYAAEHGLRYTQNAGDPGLRAAIASHYGYPGMDRVENVCVTTGSQEAMYVVLKSLLDPARDELLVVEPAFPSYVKMARLEGVAVRSVAMHAPDNFAVDAQRILAGVRERTRAIVICSPCNPTGRVIAREQAELLARGLRARAGEPIWLIHDNIYREQCFVDDAADLARCYEHTITTNSLSKSNALTGLRLGWLIAPREQTDAMIKCHAWITACADTFAQAVARSIFATPGALAEHATWYHDTQRAVREILGIGGLHTLPIEGSFYACVRLPQGMRSMDAALALIEQHDVVAIPGIAFGASFEGWLRLSWVADADIVSEGVTRIAAYLATSSAQLGKA